MSESKVRELERQGKKKAKTGELEDGSSTHSLPWYLCDRIGHISDGGTENFGESAWKDEVGGVDGEEVEMDPLVVFGSGIMMLILSKLDARSVALARLVSREWLRVASSDKIWAPKDVQSVQFRFSMPCGIQTMCEKLWLGKAHIPHIAKVQGLSKLAAYSLSVMDGKRAFRYTMWRFSHVREFCEVRMCMKALKYTTWRFGHVREFCEARITRHDLCDHIWEFHFSEAAPSYWRNLDPYWRGTGTPMHRYFHPDGSITADPDDKVWGGHESCYTIVTGLLDDGKIREHYVRINRWPQMYVQRKEDWSWELSNHLYCYTSVPDAHKEDGTGPSFPMV